MKFYTFLSNKKRIQIIDSETNAPVYSIHKKRISRKTPESEIYLIFSELISNPWISIETLSGFKKEILKENPSLDMNWDKLFFYVGTLSGDFIKPIESFPTKHNISLN